MDKIYTAKDYAEQRDGVKSVEERVRYWQRKHAIKGLRVNVVFSTAGTSNVQARIWQGHWIADCECGGAEFVDPDENIFFCFGCGNRQNGGKLRRVSFPRNREKIEQKILERPVKAVRGLDDLQIAECAQPEIYVDGQPLTRSWAPGETLSDLGKQQNNAIAAWKEKKAVKDGV